MKRFTPFLVPLCLLASGCAGTALRPDDSQQQQEMQALKARLLAMQQEAAMNQVELTQLRQRVAELEARGGARPGSSASAPAPTSTAAPVSAAPARPPAPAPQRMVAEAPRTAPASPPVSAPAPEIRREPSRPAVAVAEPIEEIEEVDIEIPEDLPQPPPRRATQPAPAQPAPAPKTTPPQTAAPKPVAPSTPPAPAPQPAAPSAAPATPPQTAAGEPVPEILTPANQVLYDRGYTLYHQGHYVDAEASFQRFLQANPGSELADNAQYWIGECRYARNDVRGALAAFREVAERFPKGNKVPDAMLKAGQSLEAMGDIEGARVTYREVGRRFPGSAAAAVAEERRGKLP
jgi:tol-pal system protein YbgF